jgi:transposase
VIVDLCAHSCSSALCVTQPQDGGHVMAIRVDGGAVVLGCVVQVVRPCRWEAWPTKSIHAWWGWPTHQRASYAGMISRTTRQVHFTVVVCGSLLGVGACLSDGL